MKYSWSAKNNAFFPVALEVTYTSSGWDLSDAIPIDDETASEFMSCPPAGKIRGVDENGMPCWIDESEPASSELTS
ncbi:TPA: tail fiber assembly protein [Escherichia coli]|nr:tail fiber assembly protein [Escherichia coli]